MGEFGVVGPDGSAVRVEDGGIFLGGRELERVIEITVNVGAVFAFELVVFGLDQLELGNDRVIRFSKASGLVGGRGLEVDLGGAIGHVDQGGDVAILRQGIGGQ